MSHVAIAFSIARSPPDNTPGFRDAIFGGSPATLLSGDTTPDHISTEIRDGRILVHLHGISEANLSATTVSNIESAVTSALSDAVSLGTTTIEMEANR